LFFSKVNTYHPRLLIHRLGFSICVLLLSLCQCLAYSIPEFEGKIMRKSKDGHIRLSWKDVKGADEGIFELERASTPVFLDSQPIYEGPDMASFISGIPDGDYYFRVRKKTEDYTSDWSKTLHLEVKHHNIQKAFVLAGLGAVVVLATVLVIVVGNKEVKI
jgi:hypothetical protein